MTWTNNHDLQPDDARESDFITTITPGISVDYTGARSFLRGFVRVPLIVHARHSDENRVRPSAALDGRFEAVRDFFFVEAQATVAQTYFSPFGTQSEDIESVSENSYTEQTYRISPYIQGRIGSEVSYLLRSDNIWRVNSNASSVFESSLASSYVNDLFGTINRNPTPFGWGADIQRTEYWYSGRDNQLQALARLRGVWQADAQLQLFVTGGYERNRFSFSDNSNAIYGGGVRWRPTNRTTLDASAEKRFFGTGYNVLFRHRTPRTVWTARAMRDTSDRPELIGRLPAGAFVPGLLFDLLASRIVDPLERAQFVADFIEDRGLPTVLSAPLDLYDPLVDIRQTAIASLALLGVRNTVIFSVYSAKTEEIGTGGTELPPLSGARNNNTQTGATAVWSNQLAPATSMTLAAGVRRTDADPPLTLRTDYSNLRLTVTHAVSPRTRVFSGMRWLKSDSTQDINDYTEVAVFAGFNHSFW